MSEMMAPCSVPEISFIVPCYNEEGNVEAMCEALTREGKAHATSFEILLIDNASIIPVVHPVTNAVVSKDLLGEGATANKLGFTPLRQLALYFYTHVDKQ